jgi:hypothetical protein
VPIAAILVFYSITSSRRLIHYFIPFALWYGRKRAKVDPGSGVFRTVSSVATLSTQKAEQGLLACSSDINGSALDDTVVQKNCSRSASTAPQRQARSGRRFHRICHRHLISSNFHQLVQE